MVTVVPQMQYADLENILKHLPDPTFIEVGLHGPFDYSIVFAQARETLPNVDYVPFGHATFHVDKPSKQALLEIYRQAQGEDDADAVGSLITPREKEPDKPVLTLNRNSKAQEYHGTITLERAGWHAEDYNVVLTPYKLSIEYQGKEPKNIRALLKDQSLAGVTIELQRSQKPPYLLGKQRKRKTVHPTSNPRS